MVKHYNWPDHAIKDISKLKRWWIDRLEPRKHNIFSTDCRLSVEVVDDYQLLLRIGNHDILARLDAALSTIPSVNGAILVNVRSPVALNQVADEIERLSSVTYDVPSFKHVCPRTANRLREFALELGTYSAPAPTGSAR